MSTAPITADTHARITQNAAKLAIGVALLLIVLKGGVWFVSGSVSILASLADSTLDLAASFFTLLALRYAAAPPDREHRYGHGKAEAFAGLMQAGLIMISAVLIGVEAVTRFLRPQPITHGVEGVLVLGAAILLTAGLVAAQTHAIKRTGSIATRVDRLHYAGDLAANLVAMGGLAAGAFFGLTWADAGGGLLIAAWLALGAVKIAREAGDHLLDRELSDAERETIRALAAADPNIIAIHGLRTRSSGPYMHIQFHAELDPGLSLLQAHEIIAAADARIRARYPAADTIIHPDPSGSAAAHGHADFERRN